MFQSKLAGPLRGAASPVELLRDPATLAGRPGRALLVNLNEPANLDAAIAWRDATGGRVIGFASHVDTPALNAARENGLEVMTNGAFSARASELLAGL